MASGFGKNYGRSVDSRIRDKNWARATLYLFFSNSGPALDSTAFYRYIANHMTTQQQAGLVRRAKMNRRNRVTSLGPALVAVVGHFAPVGASLPRHVAA